MCIYVVNVYLRLCLRVVISFKVRDEVSLNCECEEVAERAIIYTYSK